MKKKSVNIAISTAISVIAVGYVAYRLINFEEWDIFFYNFSEGRDSFLLLLLLQLILSLVNIFIESLKWQQIAKLLQPYSVIDAIRQVLYGFRLQLITPAGIGNPIGKMIFFPKEKRVNAVIFSFFGSVIQNIVILLVGIAAVVILSQGSEIDYFRELKLKYVIFTTVAFVVLLFIAALFIYYKKKSVYDKIKHYLSQLQLFTKKSIVIITILTIVRYIIFSTQFALFLNYWNNSEIYLIVMLIPIYYLTITFIPSMSIFDIGIRGSIGLLIFGLIQISVISVVIAVFLIWIYNQALPAILSFLMIKNKKIEFF